MMCAARAPVNPDRTEDWHAPDAGRHFSAEGASERCPRGVHRAESGQESGQGSGQESR